MSEQTAENTTVVTEAPVTEAPTVEAPKAEVKNPELGFVESTISTTHPAHVTGKGRQSADLPKITAKVQLVEGDNQVVKAINFALLHKYTVLLKDTYTSWESKNKVALDEQKTMEAKIEAKIGKPIAEFDEWIASLTDAKAIGKAELLKEMYDEAKSAVTDYAVAYNFTIADLPTEAKQSGRPSETPNTDSK